MEDVTKVFALLKTRAPSWYDYAMKSSESVIAATRGIYPFIRKPDSGIVQGDRSLSNDLYSNKTTLTTHTGSLLYKSMRDMSCHTTNQY
jgi:hypothetical protein